MTKGQWQVLTILLMSGGLYLLVTHGDRRRRRERRRAARWDTAAADLQTAQRLKQLEDIAVAQQRTLNELQGLPADTGMEDLDQPDPPALSGWRRLLRHGGGVN